MSSTSQEKINQVPIYYAVNSSYLYDSHIVTLASLLANYAHFVSQKAISKWTQAQGERVKNLAS